VHPRRLSSSVVGGGAIGEQAVSQIIEVRRAEWLERRIAGVRRRSEA
jgi:hypothetical protein